MGAVRSVGWSHVTRYDGSGLMIVQYQQHTTSNQSRAESGQGWCHQAAFVCYRHQVITGIVFIQPRCGPNTPQHPLQ